MTLEEYSQWWRATCDAAVKKHAESVAAKQHAKQEGSGSAPSKQGEGGNAPPTPLDSSVWADFFAQGQD
eukprot:7974907-Lingulodinium_polyedra.AAC.1